LRRHPVARAWLNPGGIVLLGVLACLVPPRAVAQGTLSSLETEIDKIQRAARPSVVTVISRSEVMRDRGTTEQPRRRIYTRVGSGVAVGEQIILTTASVVMDAEHVWIRTSNDLQVEATIGGVDPISNLALLRVSGLRLPPMHWADGKLARDGTARFRRDQLTYSIGSVSYRHQDPRLALVELTNRAYPGFSGGAVVNARGDLMGILQGELDPDSPLATDEDTRITGDVSFMLPVESARFICEMLRTEGRVRHGFLGVNTKAESVESDTQKGLRVPIGARVESVIANGPAARLGLRRGDLIVGFEGVRVENPTQLARWVAATLPGTPVEFVWVRDELQQSGWAALSESPDVRPEWGISQARAQDSPPVTTANARITDLERQIQRLNRELARLKGEAVGSR
jgi:serine protease Do